MVRYGMEFDDIRWLGNGMGWYLLELDCIGELGLEERSHFQISCTGRQDFMEKDQIDWVGLNR